MRVTNKDDFLLLDETKNYLRVDHALDDAHIRDLIEVSKEQAHAYLQNEFREQDANGEWVDTPIPFSCKLACLKMIASWYETRSDDITSINAGGATTTIGEMPWDAKRLLFPHRKLVGL